MPNNLARPALDCCLGTGQAIPRTDTRFFERTSAADRGDQRCRDEVVRQSIGPETADDVVRDLDPALVK
jgi:O-acetylhomoserine/O-acetylserine sulfhydrylase-like pyridoxal-dependent enzyme